MSRAVTLASDDTRLIDAAADAGIPLAEDIG